MTVYEELLLIEERDGTLKPEAVVKYAKNKKTALHSKFNWDDSSAAEHWRLEQARGIIRVTVTVLPNQDMPVRAFVSLRDDRNVNIGYRNITSVLSDEELRRQLLNDALSEMQVFKRKYAQLKELESVFMAMEEIAMSTELVSA